MYKAIQFSEKHIFVSYFDEYGMDILNNTSTTVRRLSKEDVRLIEESRVSKGIENPLYYSKEVEVKPEWKFILSKGISLLEDTDRDRVEINFI